MGGRTQIDDLRAFLAAAGVPVDIIADAVWPRTASGSVPRRASLVRPVNASLPGPNRAFPRPRSTVLTHRHGAPRARRLERQMTIETPAALIDRMGFGRRRRRIGTVAPAPRAFRPDAPRIA